MSAYYNEIDPYAAQWLRNLIAAGHIAPGVVDERSIEDVRPSDLAGFTQCHFFAGVGVWSHALRSAGWADDVPVWTGSCPCQPFSSAGAGAGLEDPRHLWPTFAWLIKQCRPPIIFGEQVASKAVEPWVDLVHADMEAMEYAFGAVPFPSAGVGAPHIRDRLFWVANSTGERQPEREGRSSDAGRRSKQGAKVVRHSEFIRLGNANNSRPQRHAGHDGAERWPRSGGPASEAGLSVWMADGNCEHQQSAGNGSGAIEPGRSSEAQWVANSDGRGCSSRSEGLETTGHRDAAEPSGSPDEDGTTGPTNGHWADADWLFCRDGKWRPVESGTFPLAHGAASRAGRLRAYGNAINAEAARVFIEAFLETS